MPFWVPLSVIAENWFYAIGYNPSYEKSKAPFHKCLHLAQIGPYSPVGHYLLKAIGFGVGQIFTSLAAILIVHPVFAIFQLSIDFYS